jgi:hypothetical protein
LAPERAALEIPRSDLRHDETCVAVTTPAALQSQHILKIGNPTQDRCYKLFAADAPCNEPPGRTAHGEYGDVHAEIRGNECNNPDNIHKVAGSAREVLMKTKLAARMTIAVGPDPEP